ncbi:MAG TPA: hypothetical protein VGK99_19965 [Acidobacteriota bacterium]
MPARIFVANLPFDITDKELREHFSQIGPVTGVILPVDRETGKKRGFAFIDYADKATADEAIRKFNSQMLRGQRIAVNEARPREEGAKSGPRRPGFSPSRPPGGDFRPAGAREAGTDDFGMDRPRRRADGKGPRKSKEKAPRTPRKPIPERRSGRLLFIDDEDEEGDVEFDNIATSAPPNKQEPEE